MVAIIALVLGGCGLGNIEPGGSRGGGGASGVDAGAGGGPGTTGRYHPAGFAAADAHGPETLLQQQDCRACHGSDLTGVGAAPSCDTCHTPAEPRAWRTDCTFCHGGVEDDTGAPPRNLDGSENADGIRFAAHGAHVRANMAAPIECEQCHARPTDVLSLGHVFDDTAAAAEVDFTAGLNAKGVFDGETCSNSYCHGSGRGDDGIVALAAGPQDCASCHPGIDSGSAAWSTMSGDHRRHLNDGMTCADCHASVTADSRTLLAPAQHVNGAREVVFSEATISWDPATRRCTGPCHGDNHNETW